MAMDYRMKDCSCPGIESGYLGRALKEIREARGYTQKVVSEEMGLTINFLSRLENGRKNISGQNLNKLAELYEMPASLILAYATPADGRFAEVLEGLHRKIEEDLGISRG